MKRQNVRLKYIDCSKCHNYCNGDCVKDLSIVNVVACEYYNNKQNCSCESCDNSYIAGDKVMCHISCSEVDYPQDCKWYSTNSIENEHKAYEQKKLKCVAINRMINKDESLYLSVEEKWMYIVNRNTYTCVCSINWKDNNSNKIKEILSLYDFEVDI